MDYKYRFYASLLNDKFLTKDSLEKFLLEMQNVIVNDGGVSYLARRVKMSLSKIYRSFSTTGNPRLRDFLNIMNFYDIAFKIVVHTNDPNEEENINTFFNMIKKDLEFIDYYYLHQDYNMETKKFIIELYKEWRRTHDE